MNIREMIEALEEIAQEYGDEVDVRIAEQPRWPFENEIAQIEVVDLSKGKCEVCNGTGTEEGGDEDEDGPCPNCDGTGTFKEEGEDGNVVYIAQGNQIGYLPTAACDALGWRDR